MTAHQLTKNVRDELIIARVLSMVGSGRAGSIAGAARSSSAGSTSARGRIVFPRFLDGPEVATQLFMLSRGSGPARAELAFFDEAGQPLTVILR